MYKKFAGRKMKLQKGLSFALLITFFFVSNNFVFAASQETPQDIYTGVSNASAVIKNLDYTDLKNSSIPVKEAVYETSALGSMKAFGSQKFGLFNNMTKEDALGSIYRALGREGDAQKAGEVINGARTAANRKTNPQSIWNDGYLQLAANDGLLSQQDLTDALTQDQTTLTSGSFKRNSLAERQEFGYWLAKLLENAKALQPTYEQQMLFNSFNDWNIADSGKIPYLETLIQDNVMNGDDYGNFFPKGPVSKAQAAQILKNAEDLIFPVISFIKQTGIIEGTAQSNSTSLNKSIHQITYKVRNSDGKLYYIKTTTVNNVSVPNKVETTGNTKPVTSSDLVVYKNGSIGNSTLLKTGDRIEYIVSSKDKTVRFVNDISSINTTSYYEATLNNVDTNAHTMSVTLQLKLDYPDINTGNINKQFGANEEIDNTFTYSNNILTLVDNQEASLSDINNGSDVIITVTNKLITEIRNLPSEPDSAGGVVKGIVEDNNPQLGYITLYSESGNGGYPGTPGREQTLRTYDFDTGVTVDVLKNNKKASMDDVKVGDTAFLKLGDNGKVVSVSSADNYTVKYGKVLTKKASAISVQYDDGSQQVLDVTPSLVVFTGGKAASYDNIEDGDRIRMLVNVTNKSTDLFEITIEGLEHLITNIYKGDIIELDGSADTLSAQNVEVFKNGKWSKSDQKGAICINIAPDLNLYQDNKSIDIKTAGKNLVGNKAYIALTKDYGGKDTAVVVSFVNQADKEAEPYNDSIVSAQAGLSEFTLSKNAGVIKYGDGTIVVKDGRLVSGSSIAPQDLAYVVANRSYDTGDYNADVVQINPRSGTDFAQIYRGRISKITAGKDFTVESFSQLTDLDWNYVNTPKTFTLTNQTLILDDPGILNQREFVDSGTGSYKGKSVYIIADGINALLVSTAPYGIYNAKGEISDIKGGSFDSDGNVIAEPTSLNITDAKLYNTTTFMWEGTSDMQVNILKNSIVLKDNAVKNPSDLEKGDMVRIIKKDNTLTGDGYIFIVEN